MRRVRDASGATPWLLACGVAGSVFFVSSFLIQGATREGYDPAREYVSSLSLGHGGWFMIVTFLVTGILMAAFAVGLSRSMWSGRGSTWIPRLMGCFAAGIFFAGVFTVDPSGTWPPGTPKRAHPSGHAAGHGLSADLLYWSLIGAAVLYTIRFHRQGRTGWAIYTAASILVGGFAISSHKADSLGITQRIGLIALFGWVAAIAAGTLVRLRRPPPSQPD
jgi:hypothetical membrane protein